MLLPINIPTASYVNHECINFVVLKATVKLSLCLIKYCVMKMYPVLNHQAINKYGRVEVELHPFLTSPVDNGEYRI